MAVSVLVVLRLMLMREKVRMLEMTEVASMVQQVGGPLCDPTCWQTMWQVSQRLASRSRLLCCRTTTMQGLTAQQVCMQCAPVSAHLPSLGQGAGCRQFHLNKMVKVAGVVTRRTGVFPQLQMVKFDCQKCGHLLGPYYQNTETEIRVNSCPQCQGKHCFTVRASPEHAHTCGTVCQGCSFWW